MCGIVGLYLKNPKLKPKLGKMFKPMLIEMTNRGPDSAGVAIYRNPVKKAQTKFSLAHDDANYDWKKIDVGLEKALKCDCTIKKIGNHCILVTTGKEPAVIAWLKAHHPQRARRGLRPHDRDFQGSRACRPNVYDKFDLDEAAGTHIIGHTRMATESAVTTAGSHPFATGADLCLVHNGSLSNHNRLRENLRKEGMDFQTENDTEVAAAYMTWKLRGGATLKEALEDGLRDLDGFYTFLVGTADGFAVVRDPIACKHAVMAETDDWVAMATEYRAIAHLPGADDGEDLGTGTDNRLHLGRTRMNELDLHKVGVRGINSQLHSLPKNTNEKHWVIQNPKGQHSIAVGLDAPLQIDITGHVGFYCGGMNKDAELTIHGHAGVGTAENMMSGVVWVKGNSSESAGATGNGGLAGD